jgi:cytochrome c556
MRFARIAAALTLAILAVDAPGAQMPAGQPAQLHRTMKTIVAPMADALWAVGNDTMDDAGNADARRIKPADWAKLGSAAQAMKDAALGLANAPKVIAAMPGDKLQNDGAPGATTAAQIQGFIDADPQGFATHARELAAVSDEFLQSAKSHDAVKLTAASGRLDEVCESCHTRFWYPNEGGAK